jgi:RNA polymerase sigma factor (sigma-70 family)
MLPAPDPGYPKTPFNSPVTSDSFSTGLVRPFPATRESVLLRLRSDAPDQRRDAWDSLAAAYWRPVYCHIRLRWALSREDAQDLTQEFFLRAMTGGFFDGFDPARARFRTFLRTCLDRFLSKEQRDATRQKRGGEFGFIALEVAELENELTGLGSGPGADPDVLFHREWIRNLFSRSVDALRAECGAGDKAAHFRLFELMDLLPESSEARPSYKDLADASGLTLSQVTNYLAATRRRFRELALARLAELCGSEEEYRAEARELFGVRLP